MTVYGKSRQRVNGMVKTITRRLGRKVQPIHPQNLIVKQPPKQQSDDGKPTEKNVKERKEMQRLKSNGSWIIGESIVWSIFVIVNTIAGLSMMGIVNPSHHARVYLGRVILAFALMVFFYLAYLGSKQRTI